MKRSQPSRWPVGLIAFFFWATGTQPSLAATVYTVERGANASELHITVDRSTSADATMLVLRGAKFGVAPQIMPPSCDGKPLMVAGKGQWSVPAGCRHLSWTVPLAPLGKAPANAQQSLLLANGVLLSEASSLPRLEDADPEELLRLPPGPIVPTAKGNVLPLPASGKAPLFVIIGAEAAEKRTDGKTKLLYFFDKPTARERVPDIAEHVAGLLWLRDRLPSHNEDMTFSVLWLGVPAELLSIGGAQGDGLLLVNYLAGTTKEPFDKAMRLYIPLHEAMHQFGASRGRRPVWIEESLSSYFAVRAVLAVTHESPGAKALFEKFKSGAKAFPEGLIAISSRVEQTGDQMAGIGAFYTKGVAFWDAVNTAMEKTAGHGLDTRLANLLDADLSAVNTKPDLLRSILGLPPETWTQLRKQYLD